MGSQTLCKYAPLVFVPTVVPRVFQDLIRVSSPEIRELLLHTHTSGSSKYMTDHLPFLQIVFEILGTAV